MEEIIKTQALFIVIEKEDAKKVLRILKKYKTDYILGLMATGTASASIMEYFGLVNDKREIIVALIPEFLELKILYDLTLKLKMNEPGKGMAFTINLTSGNRCLINSNIKSIPREEYYMEKEKDYELIISIMSEGYGTLCMDAAKKAGAGGGTLISGIGLGSKEATKLLGITIEPEKDVVLILSEKKDKRKIMEEISAAIGLSEEGRGISFSLPVESTIGLTDKINIFKE